jgi:hypothetical protein
MRKTLLFTSALLVLAASFSATVPARAMDCPHPMDATISALRDCVQHAADTGMIDNAGIARSLLAKVDGAQAALDRGQPAVAVNKLQAFIHEVQAQAGKHIDAEHADHMAMHAQMVIDAL